MNAAVVISFCLTLLTVGAILVLVLGHQAGRRVRQAWRSGYWTGRSELQESLAAHLAFYEPELNADSDLLGAVLLSWVQREHMTNQTLAQLQGLDERLEPLEH